MTTDAFPRHHHLTALFALLAALATALGGCLGTHGAARQGAPAGISANPDFVPSWARSAVWYQVVPDRFRDGDRRNDRATEETTGTRQLSRWTGDWFELQPWERANGRGVSWNLYRRRYGGDLQGIIDRLGYLQELGVTAIYLDALFEAPSPYKDDAASLHHIDPTFGPDPEGDRALTAREEFADPSTWVWTSADRLALRLIADAHSRGMRVLFDGQFNHMGVSSPPFRDVLARQEESPFRDWFHITSWEDPARGTHFDYQACLDLKELPELREDEHGLVQGPREYIFAVTRRWMDPTGTGDTNQGIDGWHVDVADCIAHPFWKDWRRLAKSINPQAYLATGAIGREEHVKPYLRGDEFDGALNYDLTLACDSFFTRPPHGLTATGFDERLATLRQAFPSGVSYVLQNLLDSHDTDRLARRRVAGDPEPSPPALPLTAPPAIERSVQMLMAVFQMTYVGAPLINYGDEAGMWENNDSECPRPMVWPDLHYRPEAYLPDGTRRPKPRSVTFDTALHDHYRRLIRIRNAHPALQLGDYETLLADDTRSLFGFRRGDSVEQLIVVLNNGDTTQGVQLLPDVRAPSWTDLLDEKRPVGCTPDGRLDLRLGPRSGAILLASPGWSTSPRTAGRESWPPDFPRHDLATPNVRVQLRLRVPPGTPAVYVTGNRPEWGPWNPARARLQGTGEMRSLDLTLRRGTRLEYRFTLGNWRQELRDEDWHTQDNYILEASGDATVEHRAYSFGIGSRRVENLDPDGITEPPSTDAWTTLYPRFYETFLFPGGRSKAVVISMDDGNTQDSRFVALLNRHHLKGTFHLNSGQLTDPDKIHPAEVRKVYAGHEVSCHSVHHPYFTAITAAGVRSEVSEDQKALTGIVGAPVRGIAYPFGATDLKSVAAIRQLGLTYARTVAPNPDFTFPQDFLLWPGGDHQDDAIRAATRFLATDNGRLRLLSIWGHSWQFDRPATSTSADWKAMERFCSMVGDRGDIWSATLIEMADYLEALRGLDFAKAGKVTNRGRQSVWMRDKTARGGVLELKPGMTATL